MLQLIAIKTKSNVYISNDIKGTGHQFAWNAHYLFDGVPPKETYNKAWYEVPKLPAKVESVISAKKVILHWKLIEGYVATDLLPAIIDTNEDITDEDSNCEHISGLYNPVYKETPEQVVNVEFELNVIQEFDGEFKLVQQPFKAEYNLLDKINTHPVLLQTKPCKLSSEESYRIIRQHIKENINPKVANITSDYDFCLTVEKIINLCEPEPYQVDVNLSFYGKKKKPKFETRYRNHRRFVIFEGAPKAYQNYTVVKPFEGSSYENMIENINNFLSKLMDEINEPLEDCPYCKGRGVVKRSEV